MTEPRRVAQYVRMSTENQRYSPEYQMASNAAYAAERGLEIVQTFSDHGISGLSLAKRAGLQTLLQTVLGGEAQFTAVLVYDVSRWGRFQDPDESAHYEFLCRSAGVAIRYTAEPFEDDGSLTTALVKHMKRAMAAEFSRDLSRRVSRTQRGLAAKGFWMGGPAGYGLKRLVIAPDGRVRAELKPREQSALRGDRVILAPGTPSEVRVVRRIFRQFGTEGLTVREITRALNAAATPATYGARWSAVRVRALLRNEAYVGTCVLGKRRHHLGPGEPQPSALWIRARGAFQPIVRQALFDACQTQFRVNKAVVADDILIAELQDARARHGRLSRSIIDRDPHTHCAVVYQHRFGSLSAAYARAGCEMTPQQAATSLAAFRNKPHLRVGGRRKLVADDVVLTRLAAVLAKHGRLSKELISEVEGIPHSNALTRRFGGLQGLYEKLNYQPTERQLRGMTCGRIRRAVG